MRPEYFSLLLLLFCIPHLFSLVESIQDNTILSKCCSTVSSSLLTCTNGTLNALDAPQLNKIALVTYITPSIYDYAAYSLAINAAFAEMHGYQMKILSPETMSQHDRMDERWNKVMILLNAISGAPINYLSGWAKDKEYVVWMDADLVVVDMNFAFESIVSAYPDKDIIISEDPYPDEIFSVANTGCVIVRNSEWSRRFLRAWWSTPQERLGAWDQHIFTKLYTDVEANMGLGDVQSHIQLLPADAINTRRPAIEFHLPHNPVLHMVGSVSAHRIAVFSRGLDSLCAFHSGELASLPLQLGLTKESLWEMEKAVVGSRGVLVQKLLRALRGIQISQLERKSGVGSQDCLDPQTLHSVENDLFNSILKLGDPRSGPESEAVMLCLDIFFGLVLEYVQCADHSQDSELSLDERVELLQYMQWVFNAAFERVLDAQPEVVQRVMAALDPIVPRMISLTNEAYATHSDADIYSRMTPLYYSFKRYDYLAGSYQRLEYGGTQKRDQDTVNTVLLYLYSALSDWRAMNEVGRGQQPRAVNEAVFMYFRVGLYECMDKDPMKGLKAFKEGIDVLEMHWRKDGRTPSLMPREMKDALSDAYQNLASCIVVNKKIDLFELAEMFHDRSQEVARGQFASDDEIRSSLGPPSLGSSSLVGDGRERSLEEILVGADGASATTSGVEKVSRNTKKFQRRKAKLSS